MDFILTAIVNGLLSGAVYVLVAIGLTLIYGVLHIINFAHGSLLMLAMYASFFLWRDLHVDPYLALPVVTVGAFLAGYVLYRAVIGRFSAGKDENILLITLGLSIIAENAALFFFASDTRTVATAYSDAMLEVGPVLLSFPKVVSFFGALVLCMILGLFMRYSDTGRAIRAVAKERLGARLSGIDVDFMYAVSYGIGIACLGAAACLLMPSFYVSPSVGNSFVLVAFTTVVLGGMGSFAGALAGGMLIGVAESVSSAFFGEQLGQIAIPMLFILVLLFRPTGIFRGTQ